jgi:hypothetical protein
MPGRTSVAGGAGLLALSAGLLTLLLLLTIFGPS